VLPTIEPTVGVRRLTGANGVSRTDLDINKSPNTVLKAGDPRDSAVMERIRILVGVIPPPLLPARAVPEPLHLGVGGVHGSVEHEVDVHRSGPLQVQRPRRVPRSLVRRQSRHALGIGTLPQDR
jgi:hypothetical protein